jgi:hypothetical protein
VKLKLLKGGRAQLEMELLLKIAERNVSEQELQVLFAPLKRRAQLSIVRDSTSTTPLPVSAKPAGIE